MFQGDHGIMEGHLYRIINQILVVFMFQGDRGAPFINYSEL